MIVTINGLLRWRKELDGNCTLAFIYLDSCDVFNDGDVCEMTRRCDAVVIMIASMSGIDDCQSIIYAVQTSNFAKAVYRGGKHCALFTPRNSAKASILESPIKAVPWNSVVPEVLRQRTRARLTLLLQVYVRMVFLLRPKVIFIDHKAKQKNWCMQHALSCLNITTGVSNKNNQCYYKSLLKDANKLACGQVFGPVATSLNAYNYKFQIKKRTKVTKICGQYVLGKSSILSAFENVGFQNFSETNALPVYKKLTSNLYMSRCFGQKLDQARVCVDKYSQRLWYTSCNNLEWQCPAIQIFELFEESIDSTCFGWFNQPVATIRVYHVILNNALSFNLYKIMYSYVKYRVDKLNTPAKAPYCLPELIKIAELLKHKFKVWYDQSLSL